MYIYIYICVCVCVYIYCITHIYFYISHMLSKATFLFSNFEFSIWLYLIYSCDSKNSEFSVTWSFRKHSNMLLILFVYKLWYIPLQDSLKNTHFKRTAFFKIKINVFDELNVSLVNEYTYFFLTPNFCDVWEMTWEIVTRYRNKSLKK